MKRIDKTDNIPEDRSTTCQGAGGVGNFCMGIIMKGRRLRRDGSSQSNDGMVTRHCFQKKQKMRFITYIQKPQKLVVFESGWKIRFMKLYSIVWWLFMPIIKKTAIPNKIVSANLNFHRLLADDYLGKSGYIAIKAPASAHLPEP